MNLESQVVSIELSKRLDELGVKSDSLFYWEIGCSDSNENEPVIISAEFHDSITGEWGDGHSYKNNEHYPAFTVAECGEMLPKWISVIEDEYMPLLMGRNDDGSFWINYFNINDLNEANFRAKVLIHLIENGYVKVEELNGQIS